MRETCIEKRKKRTFLFEGEDEWFLLLSLILSAKNFLGFLIQKKSVAETDFFIVYVWEDVSVDFSVEYRVPICVVFVYLLQVAKNK